MSRKLKCQESVRGGSAPTTCNPGKRYLGNRLVGGMPASLFQEIPIQGNGGSGDRGALLCRVEGEKGGMVASLVCRAR